MNRFVILPSVRMSFSKKQSLFVIIRKIWPWSLVKLCIVTLLISEKSSAK